MNAQTEKLFDAILDVNVAGVRRALAHGADVNARHPMGGLTPLHLACYRHGQRTYRAFWQSPETETIAALLLDAGADPLARDRMGPRSALIGIDLSCQMPAAWRGDGEMPKCLRDRMVLLTAANTFPEADPDKREGNERLNGRKGMQGRGQRTKRLAA